VLDQSAPFPLEDVSTLVPDTLVPAGEGAGPPEQLRLLVCIAQWGDRNSEEMRAVLAEYDSEYGHYGNSTRVAFGSSVDLIFAGLLRCRHWPGLGCDVGAAHQRQTAPSDPKAHAIATGASWACLCVVL